MKYGQEIINKYIEPIKEVEQDIAGLKERQAALTAELGKDLNKYDLKTLEQQKESRSELAMIEQALERATNHKESLERANPKEIAAATLQAIEQAKDEVNADKQVAKDKALIKSYLKEIRAAYKRLKQADIAAKKEIKKLVDTVGPYILKDEDPRLSDADIRKRTMISSNLLGKVQDKAGLNGLRNDYDLIRGVPSEDELGVKGLKEKL